VNRSASLPISPLLRVSEVARLLNVHPSTVIRLADRGILLGIQILGGRHRALRFRPEAVEKFISDRETTTRAELDRSTLSKRAWGEPRSRRG